MTWLLDASVLVALTTPRHVHHAAARAWFGTGRPFATCPITQGALIRFTLREGADAMSATSAVARLAERDDHTFWPDDLAYTAAMLRGVVGHRQVTDAYLVALAGHRGGRVATLDRGLAAANPRTVDLVPTGGVPAP